MTLFLIVVEFLRIPLKKYYHFEDPLKKDAQYDETEGVGSIENAREKERYNKRRLKSS